MKLGTRKKLAKKLGNFVKVAQAEALVEPEMLDEGDETLPDPEELEEIEEDVEEEEESSVLEDIEEAVGEISEKLETVVDALEDQKEVLETTLLDGEAMEEKFDEYKDEELEDTEEEFSEEEFGISTEGCDDKEGIGMKVGSLRSRREARLKRTAQSKNLSEEFNKPASDKKKYNPIQQTPKITKVKKDEVPEMYKLAELSFERKADNSAWMVLNAKDEAVFVIPRGNINTKEFSNDKFASKIIKEMDKHGVLKVLKTYKAKRIVKKVDAKTTKANTNDIRRRFMRATRLALNAMNKNLIKTNPLKGALFEVLTDLGVDSPMRVIEATFARAGTEHFEVAIAQAEKFMDMTDEAFVEYESQVGESEVNIPAVEGVPRIAHLSRAAELSRKAADNSLVFSTSSAFDVDAERAEAIAKAVPKPALFHAVHRQGN